MLRDTALGVSRTHAEQRTAIKNEADMANTRHTAPKVVSRADY